MKALIVGSSGFVGGYLSAHLAAHGDEVVELSPDLDISHRSDLFDAVGEIDELDIVYLLAALSHVGDSWEDPSATYAVNILGTAYLCEALARRDDTPRLVFVSSSEVYGVPEEGSLPFTEQSVTRPVSPYAASKAAAEEIVKQAVYGRSLEAVIARSFNHTGPRQSPNFVVSGLAKRFAEATREAPGNRKVAVGNLASKRDFSDVTDVVRAYRLLGLSGRSGEVYNVCSGVPRPISDVAQMLASLSNHEVELEVDPRLVRTIEVPEVYGSHEKLSRQTGWQPEVSFDSTVASLYRYWLEQTLSS